MVVLLDTTSRVRTNKGRSMTTCDVAGCNENAVAQILLLPNDRAARCVECLEFDGKENDWW